MIVRRAAPLPPLVVHVNPVRWRETDFGAWPVAALVLVVDPSSGHGIVPEVVAETLGFTAMESRVAVLIAEGMNAREVANLPASVEVTLRSRLPCHRLSGTTTTTHHTEPRRQERPDCRLRHSGCLSVKKGDRQAAREKKECKTIRGKLATASNASHPSQGQPS